MWIPSKLFKSFATIPACRSFNFSADKPSDPHSVAKSAIYAGSVNSCTASPPLFIHVLPSRYPCALLLLSSVLVLVALYFAYLSLVVVLALGLVWLLYVCQQLLRLSAKSVSGIGVDGAEWRLNSSAGRWAADEAWHLEGDCSWHPWLISLRLRSRYSGRRLQLLLYPDSCSVDDLRCLRVWLLAGAATQR